MQAYRRRDYRSLPAWASSLRSRLAEHKVAITVNLFQINTSGRSDEQEVLGMDIKKKSRRVSKDVDEGY